MNLVLHEGRLQNCQPVKLSFFGVNINDPLPCLTNVHTRHHFTLQQEIYDTYIAFPAKPTTLRVEFIKLIFPLTGQPSFVLCASAGSVDSSVGIATRYGIDGLRFDSRQRRYFSITSSEAHPVSYPMGTGGS
jgi:hypothetical protein